MLLDVWRAAWPGPPGYFQQDGKLFHRRRRGDESLNIFWRFETPHVVSYLMLRPHVMEKILLRVAGVRAEMRGGEVAQAFFAGAATREIELLQRAFHPHVHGKRGVKAVGEQQNTVGDLAAHAA